MTGPTWTLDRYRLAGHGHLHGARCILESKPAKTVPTPALTPASASYLAHVALECALKARILFRGGYPSAEALQAKLPKVHAHLFRSAAGHDLGKLATELRLEGFVQTHGKSWREDACWKRMTLDARPYSLRYGVEQADRSRAKEELDRTSELLDVLLGGIKSVPLPKKTPRAR